MMDDVWNRSLLVERFDRFVLRLVLKGANADSRLDSAWELGFQSAGGACTSPTTGRFRGLNLKGEPPFTVPTHLRELFDGFGGKR
jgi:hypothetical protein